MEMAFKPKIHLGRVILCKALALDFSLVCDFDVLFHNVLAAVFPLVFVSFI